MTCRRVTADQMDRLLTTVQEGEPSAIDAAFAQVERVLAPMRAADAAVQAAQAEEQLARLKRSRADDAATYSYRTEADDLDELEAELRASARAAVFTNGTWAVRMEEAADAIAALRRGILR